MERSAVYRNTKYSSRKTKGFDSKKEYQRYLELKLMEKAGVISDLRTQVDFELIPRQTYKGKFAEHPVKYRADFVYKENGVTVVEDCKGFKTDVYRLKKKLMLWVHGIRIKET